MNARSDHWVEAVEEQQLRTEGKIVYRYDNKQIAIFWGEGKLYALDNRCPHQGYPLKEGTLDEGDTDQEGECILTCQWHNWKFNARTGECLLGEDHVRTYPVERREGGIWLNLRDPSPEALRVGVMKGLKTAVEKRQFGRICRELARLASIGEGPLDALKQVLIWRAEHFEYGSTHAHAVTADWLVLYDEAEGDLPQQLLCLAEAIDHIAHDTLRHPVYPFPEDVEDFEGETFLAAIEAEDQTRAIAQLRGALQTGADWQALEPWFVRAAIAHYNDFGHSMIYVQKTGALCRRLGPEVKEALLLPLVRSLCLTQREDLIPMFRKYAHFVARAPSVHYTEPYEAIPEARQEPLRRASVNQAMSWVNTALTTNTVASIYDALLETCARHLLHYDTSYQDAYDKPVGQHIGWLHLTHAITFAHAVRELCERDPTLWTAGLLQMACFAGRHQAFLDPNQTPQEDHWYVEDPEAFFTESLEQVLDHGILPPIFSAHLVKMLLAIREEARRYRSLPPNDQRARCERYLLASGKRFLNAPLKQKHVRRAVKQAMVMAGLDTSPHEKEP